MAWSSETPSYCGWNELNVKNARGKMEVHYYLERKDGCADLAVVGRLKSSSKRMSFRYALKKNRSVLKKLSSLEDVKDWLDSIVSGDFSSIDFVLLMEISHVADVPATTMTEQAAGGFNIGTFMNGKSEKLIHPTINFSWMGSSWTCRKRRSIIHLSPGMVLECREQHKRLIAYLEDLYEDSKGNKMVVVRWFHKADEVGIVLTDDANDREIFFSHCLQDIKIECIDGLAFVLCPQHYGTSQGANAFSANFLLQKLYGDDGIEPYDITQLQGYWGQEMLRYLNVFIPKSGEGVHALGTDPATGASLVGSVGIRPRKRSRSADDIKGDCKASLDSVDVEASGASVCKGAEDVKKYKDKVKVQYQDIMDADDESKNLEKFEVYLPGEKKISSFHRSDLRQSLEWSADEWVQMKSTSDVVSSVLSLMKKKEVEVKPRRSYVKLVLLLLPVATTNKPSTKQPVPDLLNHVLVSDLKWTASNKRKRTASSMGDSLFSSSVVGPRKPIVYCENGKFMGDSVFGSSVGQHLAGLLMSR
ncbi:hypothetical protein Bca52824_083422 [Brassica carinata]|uniref:BAH domain-containing protein n=1 Tax=Brassica carinata TaxID=52824 RepID=A0A8X7PK62_BRACI|nr:hypothetical protein Bca52824_083422 [Brassica carinata]